MKVLVTFQEPGSPRYRCIIEAPTTLVGLDLVLRNTRNPDVYVSAKPASAEDVQQYTEFKV